MHIELDQYSDIKKVSIYTEKELINEFDPLFAILIDTNGDWNKRLNAIKKLEGIILGGAHHLANFSVLISKYSSHLTAQLNDLRSAISKEACRFICLTAKICQEKIDLLCEKLISKECLLKVINSANKIIGENGHDAILCLIEYVKNTKIIPKLIDEIVNKNQIARYRVAQYIYKIIDIYPTNTLDKYLNMIELAINHGISDANKDTRYITRQIYRLYCIKFPIKAEKLVHKFDISVQKALIDDDILNNDFTLSKNIMNDIKNNKAQNSTDPSNMLKTIKKIDIKQDINNRFDEVADQKLNNDVLATNPLTLLNSNIKQKSCNLNDLGSKSSNTSYISSKSALLPSKTMNNTNNTIRAKSSIRGQNGLNENYEEKSSLKKNDMDTEDNNYFNTNKTMNTTNGTQKKSESSSRKTRNDSLSTENGLMGSSRARDHHHALTQSQVYQAKVPNNKQSRIKSTDKYTNLNYDNQLDNDYTTNYYQAMKEDDLKFLIEKSNDENWAIRFNSFEKICEFITGLKPNEIINNQLIELLIITHIQHLSDPHVKVIGACMNSLTRLITLLPDQLFTYMEKIIPQVIINLTENKEKLYNNANFLVNLLIKIYQGDELMPILLKSFDIYNKSRYKISILEIINIIIEETHKFFDSTNNIRSCINKIGHFIHENQSNKLAAMPCLGVIYFLREKNLHQTLFNLISLPSTQLQSIRTIALQYAPELEADLKQYSLKEWMPKTSQKSEIHQGISNNPIQNGLMPLIKQKRDVENQSDFDADDETLREFQHLSKETSNLEASAEELEEIKDNDDDENLELDTIQKGRKNQDNLIGKTDFFELMKSDNSILPKNTFTIDIESINNKNLSKREENSDSLPVVDLINEGAIEITGSLHNDNKENEEEPEEESTDEQIGLDTIDRLIKEYPKSKEILEDELENIINELSEKSSNPNDANSVLVLLRKLVGLPIELGNYIETITKSLLILHHDSEINSERIEEILSKVIELGYPEPCLQILIENLDEQDIQTTQFLIRHLGSLYNRAPISITRKTIPELIDKFKKLFTHPNAEIRKNIVFCLVDLTFIFPNFSEDYLKVFAPSQQKLVAMYVQRRLEKNANEGSNKKKSS